MKKLVLIINLFSILSVVFAFGQEHLGPIRYNAVLNYAHSKNVCLKKTTSLSLPFFEDFTGYSTIPDANKWVDDEVYINNTMAVLPLSRGVATFDDLNRLGLPYDTLSNSIFKYADSLTSQPINLDYSTVTPQDSVYFSFFYQAQGNGFFPLPQDSLMLFFKNRYGNYQKVWSLHGQLPDSTLQPFQQVMIPITDSLMFHGEFQFRFVNIAASFWADAIWNIDYIRLNSNRSFSDTSVNDVAITSDPTFLLNDYTYMPYSQFMANPAGEIAATVSDSIRNDSSFAQNLTDTFLIYDITGGAYSILSNKAANTTVFSGYQTLQVTTPITIPLSSYPTYPPNSVVTFQTMCYLRSTPFTGDFTNDSITKQQIFDNYLAYDDGTAEKAWYISQNVSGALPGELEIEFHLNHSDTLRGLAIYFARQVPLATYKEFFIRIYSSLISVNGSNNDILLREQQFNFPGYIDTINHFWYYKLDTPVILPAGTFYAGTVQPAYSASDSLYFGFDVNRIGGNHAYWRVDGAGTVWNPSLYNGAIMLRPLIGHDITSSNIKKVISNSEKVSILPSPAQNSIEVCFNSKTESSYKIFDMTGKNVLSGVTFSGKQIDVSKLTAGTYIISVENETNIKLKFIKL